MKIKEKKSYLKSFKKLPKKIQISARNKIALFIEDRKNPLLHDHALKGDLIGIRAFSVTGDYRIIYEEEVNGEITFIFIDIGTHNQVYNQ